MASSATGAVVANPHLAALGADTDRLDPGDPLPLSSLAAGLRSLWGGHCLLFRPSPRERGWSADFCCFARDDRLDAEALLRDYLATAPADFCGDNLLRPPADLRNRPQSLPSTRSSSGEDPHGQPASHLARVFFPRARLAGLSQLRVLVCDGPLLLAWVGVFREQPFGARDLRQLDELVPALGRRLRWTRWLQGESHGAPFTAALEAIGAPAFVLRSDGSLEYANEAGAQLFAARGAALLLALNEARRAGAAASAGDQGSFELTEIREPGAPAYTLAVLRSEAPAEGQRLGALARRWGLTATEARVLALLVQGDSSKEIAAKLTMSPRTVEQHTASLLHKTGSDSRSRLIARFWSGR